jgi:hypothetical protein
MLTISGTVRVETDDASARYVDAAVAKVLYELGLEGEGSITQSGMKLRYHRNYDLLPGHTHRLACFSPSEFLLRSDGRFLVAEYRLGLGPLYSQAALGCLCMVILLGIDRSLTTIIVSAALTAVFGVSILVNLARVHYWLMTALKSVARTSNAAT